LQVGQQSAHPCQTRFASFFLVSASLITFFSSLLKQFFIIEGKF